jgi:hypothetical protein
MEQLDAQSPERELLRAYVGCVVYLVEYKFMPPVRMRVRLMQGSSRAAEGDVNHSLWPHILTPFTRS